MQTGKIREIPIILVHSPFWRPLVDWFHATLAGEGMIDAADLDLLRVIDEPGEVVEAIFSHYEARGFEPSARDRDILLNL